MTTLADLTATLKRRLKDQEFDEELLKDFVNEAQQEIVGGNKYPFLERMDGPFATTDQGELSLPPDWQSTIRLFAKDRKDQIHTLRYIRADEFFDEARPTFYVWCVFGNNLFYRIPKADDNNWCEVFHLYLAKPRPLKKSTDKPVLPDEYMEALILGVMARAEEYRDNFDYAQLYRNRQDELLTNMSLRYGPKNQTFANRATAPFNNTTLLED